MPGLGEAHDGALFRTIVSLYGGDPATYAAAHRSRWELGGGWPWSRGSVPTLQETVLRHIARAVPAEAGWNPWVRESEPLVNAQELLHEMGCDDDVAETSGLLTALAAVMDDAYGLGRIAPHSRYLTHGPHSGWLLPAIWRWYVLIDRALDGYRGLECDAWALASRALGHMEAPERLRMWRARQGPTWGDVWDILIVLRNLEPAWRPWRFFDFRGDAEATAIMWEVDPEWAAVVLEYPEILELEQREVAALHGFARSSVLRALEAAGAASCWDLAEHLVRRDARVTPQQPTPRDSTRPSRDPGARDRGPT